MTNEPPETIRNARGIFVRRAMEQRIKKKKKRKRRNGVRKVRETSKLRDNLNFAATLNRKKCKGAMLPKFDE